MNNEHLPLRPTHLIRPDLTTAPDLAHAHRARANGRQQHETRHDVGYRGFQILVVQDVETVRAYALRKDGKVLRLEGARAVVLCEGPDRDAVAREGCSVYREFLRRLVHRDRMARKGAK